MTFIQHIVQLIESVRSLGLLSPLGLKLSLPSGESMNIPYGFLCIEQLYDPTSQSIQVGDLIVFGVPNGLIQHRVIRIDIVEEERKYITKGDNNKKQDSGYRTDKDIRSVQPVFFPSGPLRRRYLEIKHEGVD